MQVSIQTFGFMPDIVCVSSPGGGGGDFFRFPPGKCIPSFVILSSSFLRNCYNAGSSNPSSSTIRNRNCYYTADSRHPKPKGRYDFATPGQDEKCSPPLPFPSLPLNLLMDIFQFFRCYCYGVDVSSYVYFVQLPRELNAQ